MRALALLSMLLLELAATRPTIDLRRIERMTPAAAGRMLLGVTGTDIVEHKVHGPYSSYDTRYISLATRPVHNSPDLCTSYVTTIAVTPRSTGKAVSFMLGTSETSRMFRMLPHQSLPGTVPTSDRCAGAARIIGAASAPGFFTVVANGDLTGGPFAAEVAARLLRDAAGKAASGEGVRCTDQMGQSMNLCGRALAELPSSLLHPHRVEFVPCQEQRDRTCVRVALPLIIDGSNWGPGIVVTIETDADRVDRLTASAITVRGVAVLIAPPVAV